MYRWHLFLDVVNPLLWCDAEDTILLLFVVPPFRICSAWCNVTHILPIYGNVSVASFFYTFLQYKKTGAG